MEWVLNPIAEGTAEELIARYKFFSVDGLVNEMKAEENKEEHRQKNTDKNKTALRWSHIRLQKAKQPI